MNSSFAQFNINIRNIPHLWPFYTYSCGFLCSSSKSYFECVVILTRVVIVMVGIRSIEKIRNERVTARAGVANRSYKTREARLQWMGHVDRKKDIQVWLSHDRERPISTFSSVSRFISDCSFTSGLLLCALRYDENSESSRRYRSSESVSCCFNLPTCSSNSFVLSLSIADRLSKCIQTSILRSPSNSFVLSLEDRLSKCIQTSILRSPSNSFVLSLSTKTACLSAFKPLYYGHPPTPSFSPCQCRPLV